MSEPTPTPNRDNRVTDLMTKAIPAVLEAFRKDAEERRECEKAWLTHLHACPQCYAAARIYRLGSGNIRGLSYCAYCDAGRPLYFAFAHGLRVPPAVRPADDGADPPHIVTT